jgi:hypothetical protein
MILQIVQICVSLSVFILSLYGREIREWLDRGLPGFALEITKWWLVVPMAVGVEVIIEMRQRIGRYWVMIIEVGRYLGLFVEKIRDLARQRLIPGIKAVTQILEKVRDPVRRRLVWGIRAMADILSVVAAIIAIYTLLFRPVDSDVITKALESLTQQAINVNLTAIAVPEDNRSRIQATQAVMSGAQTAVAQTATAILGESAVQRQAMQTAIAATQTAQAQTATAIVEEHATRLQATQAAIFATQTVLAQKVDSYAATLTAIARATPPRSPTQTPRPWTFTPVSPTAKPTLSATMPPQATKKESPPTSITLETRPPIPTSETRPTVPPPETRPPVPSPEPRPTP